MMTKILYSKIQISGSFIIILITILALLVISTIILCIRYRKTQKMISNIDRTIDKAIAGTLVAGSFDETYASKLEAKFAGYMSAGSLRWDDLYAEQNKTRTLISDISHQTKTPISNILLNAELLMEQPDLSDDSFALITQLNKSTKKLSFLIDSLVKTSRLESGTIQVRPVQGDLYKLASSCIEDFRSDAEAKNISLLLNRPPSKVLALYDPKWCAEAVCNIIDNAVKYTPQNGNITITLEDYEMFACIKVSDTGKGMKADELTKIYERFFRSADSAAYEGVGIGLYLSREIIKKCGGYIQVTSELGKGSSFFIYLSKL